MKLETAKKHITRIYGFFSTNSEVSHMICGAILVALGIILLFVKF